MLLSVRTTDRHEAPWGEGRGGVSMFVFGADLSKAPRPGNWSASGTENLEAVPCLLGKWGGGGHVVVITKLDYSFRKNTPVN